MTESLLGYDIPNECYRHQVPMQEEANTVSCKGLQVSSVGMMAQTIVHKGRFILYGEKK